MTAATPVAGNLHFDLSAASYDEPELPETAL